MIYLKKIEIYKYTDVILLAFLTSVYPVKISLNYYNSFYENIKQYLSSLYDDDELKNILCGLK